MVETILVTGATGVVGRPLVRALAAAGKKVVALSRQIMPFAEAGALADIEYLQGDVSLPLLGLDEAVYRELCLSIRGIFHLAARTDFKSKALADYEAVNINGVKNVYALAQEAGAHLHHVSTAFVCGTHPGIFAEDDLDCGQQFRNGYEESKFRAERWLHERITSGDTAVTIYRPSIILERQPSQNSVNTFGPFIFLDAVFRILLTSKMQTGKTSAIRIEGQHSCHLPFIFDDDVTKALLHISQSPDITGKTYHVVCHTPCANSLLEDVFNEAFGRKVAELVAEDVFVTLPPSQPERIIARKTAMYAPYLDLSVLFDRRSFEGVMGKSFCTSVEAEELLQAFSFFLACKNEGKSEHDIAGQERQEIEDYFEQFLPAIIGQQLIANLVSLTCTFWLEVGGSARRSLVVKNGCLAAIISHGEGAFGYKVRPEIFLQVVSGRLSPQRGFFDGNIAMEGNTMEALRTATALEEFFQRRPYLVA
ncbi:MAG: SDR family oxidoreductase [Proteobacteria bacterium]|nr:SDR family oxidoreductase [Pseudomonadota bacterium]MBU1640667.1 SDR family oxidoreductase [Pseudomonadota bacterium]